MLRILIIIHHLVKKKSFKKTGERYELRKKRLTTDQI